MLDCLTSEAAGAVAIVAVDKSSLPGWLDANPQCRDWLAAVGFRAEQATHAFVPASGGEQAIVLASPAEGEAVWSFAGLAGALPEGRYRLQRHTPASATDIALGGALDAYRFTAYKAAGRAPATLVWPEAADRAKVERLARAMTLARDMINTPA